MFGIDYFKKKFKERVLDQRNSDDLALIDDAFSAIDKHRGYFEEVELIYEAKYPEQKLKELMEYNINAIYVPFARDCVNAISGQFVSAFFSGRDPIEFSGEQKELIAQLNKFISQELYRAKPTTELLAVFVSTLVYGFGCAMIRWDEEKRLPITTCLPIDAFALDPKATNIIDSKYCCYRQSISFFDAKTMYGEENLKNIKIADYDRIEVKEIYKQIHLEVGGKKIRVWKIKTFIDRELVKEDVTTVLPFYYGYAIKKLPKRKKDPNKKEISYFGGSIIDLLSSYQDELNKKRNQKIAADDNAINPRVLYTSDFPIEITQSGAGTAKQVSSLDSYRIYEGGNAVSVDRDIDSLRDEAMRAAGLNSINMGQTGASDRRSFNALSFINANSGVRVEQMIVTVMETLFHNWALGFVQEIRTRSDNILLNLVDTSRMKINFGSPTAVAQRIQELTQALQITSQSKNVDPSLNNDIIAELLTNILGKDYDPQKFFKKEESPESMGIL